MSIITESLESSEDFLIGFQKLADKTQDELLKVILDKLTKLSSRRGTLVFNDESANEINQLIKEIYRDFDFKNYQDGIGGLLRNVNDIGKTTIELTSLINESLDNLDFTSEKKFIINEISEALATPESFKVNILGDVRRIIAKRILLQSSIADLKEELKASLTASQQNAGTLGRYVGQVTKDAVYQYQGRINQAIKQKFGLDAYNYIGSLMKTSRPQCRKWIEEYSGVLLIDTKPETNKVGYLPDEVKWAKENGSGYGTKGKPYYLDLTVENFPTIRGGYNCNHKAIPFRMSERQMSRVVKLQKEYAKEMERLNIEAA